MAAKTIKKSETVIWLPPRAVGERVFASEPQLLAIVHSVEGSRYARLSLDTLPKVRTATLVIDARDVSLIPAKLPPLSGAKLRAAVPNVVEDNLLQDTSTCSFGVGPAMADGQRLIAVVDKPWLEFVVGAIERRGIRVTTAVPSQLALPYAPGVATVACVHDGLAVRTGRLDGIGWSASDENDFRTEALSAALATVLAPPTMRAFNPMDPATGTFGRDEPSLNGDDEDDDDAQTESAEKIVPQATGFQAERLVACIEDDSWKEPVELIANKLRLPVQFLPMPIPQTDVVNMLDGRNSGMSVLRRLSDIDWRAWRWPAILTAASVGVFLLGLNLHWGKLAAERDDLREDMRTTLKTAFPDFPIDRVPGDPGDHMSRKVRDLRSNAGQTGPDDFIPLMARFSQALGTDVTGSLTGLEYRDGKLRVRFQPEIVKSRAKREDMRQACKRLGLVLQFDAGQNPNAARVSVL